MLLKMKTNIFGREVGKAKILLGVWIEANLSLVNYNLNGHLGALIESVGV